MVARLFRCDCCCCYRCRLFLVGVADAALVAAVSFALFCCDWCCSQHPACLLVQSLPVASSDPCFTLPAPDTASVLSSEGVDGLFEGVSVLGEVPSFDEHVAAQWDFSLSGVWL